MNQRKDVRGKKIRNTILSIIGGGAIVWFLLSKIDVLDVPRTISKVSPWSFLLAFLLYVISVFLKSLRFKIILRTGISLKRLFPIISLYTFFTNILPMRAGELSYIYMLKKRAKTPGTKSFASLIIAAIADAVVILIAMLAVGWHLREALAEGISRFRFALEQRLEVFAWITENSLLLFIIFVVSHGGGLIALILLRRYSKRRRRASRIRRLASSIKTKVLEVWRELANTSFDLRLLGIIACSILIIVFRFGTQWYLVRSMGINIGIWQLSFALLFGVLFSLVPIHGPAGFGTVEGPWVLTLSVLNVPLQDAITSGLGLHIIIIIYCVILGAFGFSISKIANQKSKIENV